MQQLESGSSGNLKLYFNAKTLIMLSQPNRIFQKLKVLNFPNVTLSLDFWDGQTILKPNENETIVESSASGGVEEFAN